MSIAHHLSMIAAYTRDSTFESKNTEFPEVGLMFKTMADKASFLHTLKSTDEFKSMLTYDFQSGYDGFWIGGVHFRFFSEEELK